MPKLYITEYSHLGLEFTNHHLNAPTVPPIAEQRIEIGFESVASKPFAGATRFIEVTATEDCCLAFGPSPVAKGSEHLLLGRSPKPYAVAPGHRIAVIAAEQD